MATIKTPKKVKKAKKHGVKAGQKSLVKASQKKSVKNGRHQEKETPKKKIAKAIKALPPDLDGQILTEGFEDVDYADLDHNHEVGFDSDGTDDLGFDEADELDIHEDSQ